MIEDNVTEKSAWKTMDGIDYLATNILLLLTISCIEELQSRKLASVVAEKGIIHLCDGEVMVLSISVDEQESEDS